MNQDCIVPVYGNNVQPARPIWGRPPPYPRAYASMLDPEAIRGLGQTHRYVDHSTLNNRYRYAHLAGVGGTGAGSLGGSALGNSGLGASPPNNVCLYMQYECQHWNEYPPETQAEIIKVANTAAAQHSYQLEQAKAAAIDLSSEAEDHAMQAQNTASASVAASEAAYKAAEQCDAEIMEKLILESDNYHGFAVDHTQQAGELANQVYKIAGTGYFAQDQTIVQAAEKASAAAGGAGNAAQKSQEVRQQVIAAARAKLGQCGGELPPPPVVDDEKKGVQRAGLLWVGLLGLGATALYFTMKKK